MELHSTDENKEVSKNTKKIGMELKINGGKKGEYGKDFIKIKFGTNDDLPLNKLLKFPAITICF